MRGMRKGARETDIDILRDIYLDRENTSVG